MHRRIALLAALTVLAGPATGSARPQGAVSPSGSVQAALVQQMNALRAARGLSRLRLSPALNAAAAAHSTQMARMGYFSHNSANGQSFSQRVASYYPPRGYRSFGPVRASIYAGTDYVDHANTDLIVMPMIETAEALKNLDAILSTPGVDAIYVGPADLSLALGCKPRLDQTDTPVVEAQQQIVEACKRHNVVAGIHNATAAYSLKMIAAGYRFVTLASDTRHLAMKAAEEVAAVRKGVGTGVVPAY